MTSGLLEFDRVSKSFGRQRALDAVSFTVDRGEIVGLIGPNGAGKSTAMRVLTGLLVADAGAIRVGGVDQRRDPRAVRAQIGALIEGPACYPGLTALDHLEYLARIRGRADHDPKDVLRTVGLDPSSRKPVRQFSLGMKQRLGIAMATLGEPSLLVLDEPMNGLDSLGMAELRSYLRRLPSASGAAVLVSSHLLGEVEQICDRVLLIREGRIVRDTTVSAIRDGHQLVRLRTSDDARAEATLRAEGVVDAVERNPEGLVCRLQPVRLGRVAPVLVAAGIELYELAPSGRALEALYVSTYGGSREGDPS